MDAKGMNCLTYSKTKEGTMIPAEGPAANPGRELMGKEDEPVLTACFPML